MVVNGVWFYASKRQVMELVNGRQKACTFRTIGQDFEPAGRKTNEIQVGVFTNSFTWTSAGELTSLSDGKGNTTSWKYDSEGRVTEKRYQGQSTADLLYWYNANGWLTSRFIRTGAGSNTNGYTTTYAYDAVGNLTQINYPSGTASVTNQFDALNRHTNRLDGLGQTKYTYAALGNGMRAFREDGPWSNDDVIVTDRYGLHSALAIAQPTGQFLVTNSWDAAGRWVAVGGTAGTFTYAYPADSASSLPISITLPGGGYITNQYDTLARLTRTELRTSGTARRSRNHTVAATELRMLHGPYALAPRCLWRLRRTAEWVEQIHRIGVVRSNTELCQDGRRPNARRLLSRCASEIGLQAVQCPSVAAAGILAVPARRNRNTRWTNTTVQTLAAVPIAVNCQCTRIHANDRRSNPATRDFSVGPRWTYIYDHENRLTCVQTDTYYTPESYRFKVEFVYDGQGRMRIKRNYIWSGGGWYGSGGETRYLYDLPAAAAAQAGGMLIVQERDSGNVPTVTYTRGRDLSGTVDGAGGIGGLLARSHGYSSGSWAYHNFYHSDGNGNVTALVNSSGTLQASYIYDPYGRYLSGTGTLLTSNVMRFSSKPWVSFLSSSATSGLYYYGYRFYDPYLQRWLNRDRLEEAGGDHEAVQSTRLGSYLEN